MRAIEQAENADKSRGAMSEPILFEPIYEERVWGGRALQSELGRALPPGRIIGESWEIVDRPGAQSRVSGGAFAGMTIRELLCRHSLEIMGPGWSPEAHFPLLVKWLDTREPGSLQVHPCKLAAAELQGEPKTENWYVVSAAPDARLIVGLKRNVGQAELVQAIANGTVDRCIHQVPVGAGDSILVQSGQVHAGGAGCLMLEIQQNSDTTYRIYDWGRNGMDGRPRQLHIEQSLRSIQWEAGSPELVRASPSSATIAECDEFTIRKVVLGATESHRVAAGEQPRLLSVVDGSVQAGGMRLRKGTNALLPFCGEFTFTSTEAATLLLTGNFANRRNRHA